MKKMKVYKSDCPQYLALDVFGDKWTLLIMRDMMINGKKYFREFLQSKEKIATNILSKRLKALEEEGIIYKKSDPQHKQKIIYLLTEKGIDLFPILMENARWSLKYQPVNEEDAAQAQEILDGGLAGIQAVMGHLKEKHLTDNHLYINAKEEKLETHVTINQKEKKQPDILGGLDALMSVLPEKYFRRNSIYYEYTSYIAHINTLYQVKQYKNCQFFIRRAFQFINKTKITDDFKDFSEKSKKYMLKIVEYLDECGFIVDIIRKDFIELDILK